MNDDYKKGLVTGLAMQPLFVVTEQGGGKAKAENYCSATVTTGLLSNDGKCKFINFEEG